MLGSGAISPFEQADCQRSRNLVFAERSATRAPQRLSSLCLAIWGSPSPRPRIPVLGRRAEKQEHATAFQHAKFVRASREDATCGSLSWPRVLSEVISAQGWPRLATMWRLLRAARTATPFAGTASG